MPTLQKTAPVPTRNRLAAAARPESPLQVLTHCLERTAPFLKATFPEVLMLLNQQTLVPFKYLRQKSFGCTDGVTALLYLQKCLGDLH